MRDRTAPTPTRFVILATQRTGSTWLADTLAGFPSVASYEELFLPGADRPPTWGSTDREFFHGWYSRRVKRDSPPARAFWSFRYLADVYAPRPGIHAVGFKLMYAQLKTNPWLVAYLPARRVHVVHLVRNLLDVLISRATAQARNQYHATRSERVEHVVVTLDPATLLPSLERLDRDIRTTRRLLRVLPVPSIEVAYEELSADPHALERVYGFLGIAAGDAAPGSRMQKLNPADRRQLLANYEEIESVLRGTLFASLLES